MASIIESFYILFKSIGAAEVVKDEEKLEKSGDKLEKSLDGLDQGFKKVGSEITAIGRNLAGMAAAVLSAAAIFGSLKAAVSNVQDLSKTSKILGVDIETLDAWGKAITKAGGDANTFQSSVKSLAEHLGTSPKVALQALLPLADAFQRLGRFRAIQYGKKLGLDEATILLLQRGRRAVQAVIEEQKKLGVITKHDQEVTDKYTVALANTEQAFGSLARAVATEALPVLTKFFDVVATPAFVYLTEHKDLIIGAMLAIGAAATVMAAPFIPMLASITAVTAAIGALALAYEDIKGFTEGKKSVTGTIFNNPQAATGDQGQTSIYDLLRNKVIDDIKTGKTALNTAANNPFNSLTTNSIANTGGDKNQNINISEITINTQSADAEGIRTDLLKNLQSHFWQANNNFANGQAY